MAKTLVIAGADYSVNAFDTVNFDRVPCTGIALDKQTDEIESIGGTTTLTPTLTPANTTDSVTWASSDENVATVADGVVTSIGLGTAVITATCGEQSASCSVLVSVIFNDVATKYVPGYLSGDAADASGNGLPTISTSLANRGGLASNTGDLHFYSNDTIYPFILPPNTARLKITYKAYATTKADLLLWFNHETSASGFSTTAKLIHKTKQADMVPGQDNTLIIDVPSVEGFPVIDAIAVCCKVESGSFTENDFADVIIEFLPAAT